MMLLESTTTYMDQDYNILSEIPDPPQLQPLARFCGLRIYYGKAVGAGSIPGSYMSELYRGVDEASTADLRVHVRYVVQPDYDNTCQFWHGVVLPYEDGPTEVQTRFANSLDRKRKLRRESAIFQQQQPQHHHDEQPNDHHETALSKQKPTHQQT